MDTHQYLDDNHPRHDRSSIRHYGYRNEYGPVGIEPVPVVHLPDAKGEVNNDNEIDFILNKKQYAGTRRRLQRLGKVEVCKAIDAMEHNQTFITSPAAQLMINRHGANLLKCK